MTHMTPEKWDATASYMGAVFGPLEEAVDRQLSGLMERAAEAGLPRIAVSADVGRILMVLASLVSGPGGGRAVEVGTLGGYSALWLARGLGESGKLITIEPEASHAAFARSEIAKAGMEPRIQVREATGLDELPRLADELGPGSQDLIFLDAIKHEYRRYAEHAAGLLRRGGLLVADNCLGASWWITDEAGSDEDRDAVDRFNRWIGSPDSGFLACCVANREGLVVARKV